MKRASDPGLQRRRWCAPGDRLLLAGAAVHGIGMVCWPCIPVLAVGLWWNAQTVSHAFIHRPFFAVRRWNSAVSAVLTVLLGFPQSLWRTRHLAHHAGRPPRVRVGHQLVVETVLLAGLWGTLAVVDLRFLLLTYVPGIALGLTICGLHGHYEHARGTTSHYGRAYNLLFLNDGFHAEHHAHPAAPWWRLPALRLAAVPTSRWPPPLRWLESAPLNLLERGALWSGGLQRWVLRTHGRALQTVLASISPPQRIGIVGGGLFPRTALLLRGLLPRARLTLVDGDAGHLRRAARRLDDPSIELVNAWFDPSVHVGFDLIVIPLAYAGDREALYRNPPAAAMLVHDWVWRRRGVSAVVSFGLLKRVNLVCRRQLPAVEAAGRAAC